MIIGTYPLLEGNDSLTAIFSQQFTNTDKCGRFNEDFSIRIPLTYFIYCMIIIRNALATCVLTLKEVVS